MAKAKLKMLRKTVQFLLLLIIFWIVALFGGLPVIPWVETDYYESQTKQKLSSGLLLKQLDSTSIRLEIPEYFSASEQCVDIWFTSGQTNDRVTVKRFSLKIFDDGKTELPITTTYLFGNDNSRFNGTEISKIETINGDTTYQEKYKFIRTVFNLRNKSKYNIEIKVNYAFNNIAESLTKDVEIYKKRTLTWNKFRAH